MFSGVDCIILDNLRLMCSIAIQLNPNLTMNYCMVLISILLLCKAYPDREFPYARDFPSTSFSMVALIDV
jgi:hypothetical protein